MEILSRAGLPAAGRKKIAKNYNFCEKSRSKPGIAFLGKNTALRTPITSNSSMENPILRTEFLFYIDLYVNQR
jgi:hypothetical protein